jgi:hypothetical protein
MKRSNQFVKKEEEESKRQKRDLSPRTVTEVLAQIHVSDFEDDMSEPESRPKESKSKSNPNSLVHPENYYHIRETEKRSSRKFRTTAYKYTVKFKDFKSNVPLEKAESFITELWDSLLTTLKRQCHAKDDDRLRLSIEHDALKSPVWIEFSSPEELTAFKVIDKIQHVQQSNDQFDITDGKATLSMTHVSPPQGTGRKKVSMVNGFRSIKRSLVQINNPQDQMCLVRAIVVGRTYADKNDTSEWKRAWGNIRKSNQTTK